MKFRYDISALRAIAVIGVILFHFQVPYVGGGFAGVDVFFVISGYLMSRIILTSLEKDKFSFMDFYWKRAKRILPALLFLIVVVSVLGFFVYFPKDYMANERNAAASSLFISNFLYWKTTNYFFQTNNEIFLHTWSLSVEWQFYLLYPVLLLFLKRVMKSDKQLLYLFSFITLLSILGSQIFSFHHSHTAFYLLPTRAWEMMIGGVAFLLEGFLKDFKYKGITAVLGYFAILLSFWLMNNQMVWPGVFTLIPVFATFLVIISGFNESRILSFSVIQFIGNISYSLYLWHWPVFVFMLYLGLNANVLELLVISILLATISFKFIESNRFNDRKILLVVFAIAICGVCAAFSYIDVNQYIFKAKSLRLAKFTKDYKDKAEKIFRQGTCFVPFEEGATLNKKFVYQLFKIKETCCLLAIAMPPTFIWHCKIY